MPLVSFSHYREKCFFVCPTLPNYASIFFINIEGRQKKNAILDNVKKKRVHMETKNMTFWLWVQQVLPV